MSGKNGMKFVQPKMIYPFIYCYRRFRNDEWWTIFYFQFFVQIKLVDILIICHLQCFSFTSFTYFFLTIYLSCTYNKLQTWIIYLSIYNIFCHLNKKKNCKPKGTTLLEKVEACYLANFFSSFFFYLASIIP